MLADSDRKRISPRVQWEVLKVARAGVNTGFGVESYQPGHKVKQIVTNDNIGPHAFMVGNTAYNRFTFKKMFQTKTLPDRELIIKPQDPDFVGSKGFLTRHDTSLRDQAALQSLREQQFREEIENVKKLYEQRPYAQGTMGGAITNLPQSHIANIAHPHRVINIPSTPVVQPRQVSNLDAQAGNLAASQISDAVRELRTERNLQHFNQTITQRRGRPNLTVDTNVNRSIEPYNYDLWTYSPSQYATAGGTWRASTSIPWGDTEKLKKYINEYWNYPAIAGQKLLEANPRLREEDVAARTRIDREPRKRSKSFHSTVSDQQLVRPNYAANPRLSETVLEVSQRIRQEMNAPPPRQEPVSMAKTKYGNFLDERYGRQGSQQFNRAKREQMLLDLRIDYGDLVTDSFAEEFLRTRKQKKVKTLLYNFTKRHMSIPSVLNPSKKTVRR